MKFYNRQGQEITEEQYYALACKRDYRRIAQDKIGDYTISTVWTGMWFPKDGEKPMIFETMVFFDDSYVDIFTDKYSTEEEAIAGHKWAVDNIGVIKDDHEKEAE